MSDPQTGAISYTYTALGARNTMTLPGGGTWTYSYVSCNAVNDQQFYNSSLLFPDGDPDKMTQALSSITDDAGRSITCVLGWTGNPHQAVEDKTFDIHGALVSQMATNYYYNNGTGVYGSTGRLGGGWTDFSLSALLTNWQGPINGVGPGSQTRLVNRDDYAYDSVGLRTSYTTSTQGLDTTTGLPKLDANNNPVITSRTEAYTYDDLSRLKTVDYGDGETQSYLFDAMGNRQSLIDTIAQGSAAAGASGQGGTNTTTYGYDNANRLTGVTLNGGTATAVTSDADGNTLTDQAGRTFTWDAQNRMTSCTLPGGSTTTFTYGADGLRRSMTTGGIETRYVYDGTMLVRQYQVDHNAGTGPTETATYFQGLNGPAYYRNDLTDSVAHWYAYNGLGSVVGEVDPAGNYFASGEYDVYGAPRGCETAGSFDTRQRFVGRLGHQTDPETGGLVYMQARYYDPATGRFANEDPKGVGGNWYAYCADDPIGEVDATGCAPSPLPAAQVYLMIFGLTAGFLFTLLAFQEGAAGNFFSAYTLNSAAFISFALAAFGADDNPGQGWVDAALAAAELALPALLIMTAGEVGGAKLSNTMPALNVTLAITMVYSLECLACCMTIGLDAS